MRKTLWGPRGTWCEREGDGGLSNVEVVLRGFAAVIDRRAEETVTKLSRSVKEQTKSQMCQPCRV